MICPYCGFDNPEGTFYCRKCGGIVSVKTCPHDKAEHIVLWGTQVRQMLERGESLPPEFTRQEVSAELSEGLRRKREQASKAS